MARCARVSGRWVRWAGSADGRGLEMATGEDWRGGAEARDASGEGTGSSGAGGAARRHRGERPVRRFTDIKVKDEKQVRRVCDDYYTLLGVKSDATEAELKAAYFRQALKHHPDKGGDDALFRRIAEAWHVLSDPIRRQHYDLEGLADVESFNLDEYLTRFRDMILTINGLGVLGHEVMPPPGDVLLLTREQTM